MNPRTPPRVALALLAALVATAVALGGAEVVLINGQILRGDAVRLEGEVYILTTDSGEVTMPVDLVRSVKLTGAPEPKPPALEGIPDGPTGIKPGAPQQLAGPEVQAPTTEEQVRAIGRPSEFQKGVIDSNWVPTTDWNMDPNVQNNWAPSTWQPSVIDPTWVPESAFDAKKDVLAESRSTWAKAPIDSSWAPTDGFKKSAP